MTDPEFLSPNSLLLGRSSDRIDCGPFKTKDLFADSATLDMEKFMKVEKITDQFWTEWMKSYFPTLLRSIFLILFEQLVRMLGIVCYKEYFFGSGYASDFKNGERTRYW